MTIGERIAQKRKELGLSQEALGEKMGVSRQSIYKWESDAALPEIENLIKLAREFGVSVDWLLGEEGDEPEKRELTPAQLAMVEEIVGRYLDARKMEEAPEPQAPPEDPDEAGEEPEVPRRRRRWPYVLAGAAAVAALCLVFSNLFSRLDQVTQNYTDLQNSVNSISSDVNSQIGSIAYRVEEVLQRQNDLTAEQSAEVVSTDYTANTVTISARALPRTFTEGMTAEFVLESGGESFAFPGVLGEDHAFTAEFTVPLSDHIPVSAVLLTGDQRQTQLLEEFFYLYNDSFPEIDSSPGNLWGSGSKIREDAVLRIEPEALAQIQSLHYGLFRDQKLLTWYEQLDSQPANYTGDWGNALFFRLSEPITMEPGHVYCQAAVVVDQYGRERVYPGLGGEYNRNDDFVDYVDAQTYYPRGTEPEGWEY